MMTNPKTGRWRGFAAAGVLALLGTPMVMAVAPQNDFERLLPEPYNDVPVMEAWTLLEADESLSAGAKRKARNALARKAFANAEEVAATAEGRLWLFEGFLEDPTFNGGALLMTLQASPPDAAAEVAGYLAIAFDMADDLLAADARAEANFVGSRACMVAFAMGPDAEPLLPQLWDWFDHSVRYGADIEKPEMSGEFPIPVPARASTPAAAIMSVAGPQAFVVGYDAWKAESAVDASRMSYAEDETLVAFGVIAGRGGVPNEPVLSEDRAVALVEEGLRSRLRASLLDRMAPEDTETSGPNAYGIFHRIMGLESLDSEARLSLAMDAFAIVDASALDEDAKTWALMTIEQHLDSLRGE